MTVNLSALAGAGVQFLDNNGNILSGGKLYSYAAGTTTPQTTYTSASGSTAHTNPIILNSAGRVATGEIWLTENVAYKFSLYTSANVLIATYDDIPGINDSIVVNAFASNLANTSDPTLGDALVGFRQSNSSGNLTGSVGSTVHKKLQEIVSVKDFGAVGDGVADDTVAIQAAVNAGRAIYFPAGTYLVSDTIRKATPLPTAMHLFGASRFATTVKATVSMTNKPIFWFGNDLGHGAPRTEIFDINIDGSSIANGNTGIYLQEGGLCHLWNLRVNACGTGIGGYGATATIIDGLSEISGCGTGVLFDWPDDVSISTGVSNELRVRNVWFGACNQAVYAVGEMIEISGCTAQSVGTDGTKHIFEVNNTKFDSSSFYGAIIFNNWIEGGDNKYAIAAINADSAKIYNNLIIGSGSSISLTREGGVLISGSSLSQVYGNVFYQFFQKPPQDGRLANAAVYVVDAANTGQNWRVYGNTLFRSQAGNQYYFENLAAPTLSKNAICNVWGYATISGTTATITNAQNVASVVYVSAGVWQINFAFNRESTDVPFVVTPVYATPLGVSFTQSGLGAVRVRFQDDTGVNTNPDAISFMCMVEQNQN